MLLQHLQKAIKAGRIRLEPDGTIDPVRADTDWAHNTQMVYHAEAQVGPQGGNPDGNPGGNRAARAADAVGEMAPPSDSKPKVPDYRTSRAIREAYAARLAKLEYEERTGRLVNRDEAKMVLFQAARRTRDRLLQLPRKLAPEIVAVAVANPDQRVVETMTPAPTPPSRWRRSRRRSSSLALPTSPVRRRDHPPLAGVHRGARGAGRRRGGV
jgi:hypothetical protein